MYELNAHLHFALPLTPLKSIEFWIMPKDLKRTLHRDIVGSLVTEL